MITENDILIEEEDIAGKWRVWVQQEDGNSLMFKFQEHPTLSQIQKALDNYLEFITRIEEEPPTP